MSGRCGSPSRPVGRCALEAIDKTLDADAAQGDNNWNDLLKEVVTFDSVEEFWGVYVCSSSPFPTHSLPHDPLTHPSTI